MHLTGPMYIIVNTNYPPVQAAAVSFLKLDWIIKPTVCLEVRSETNLYSVYFFV